MHASQKCHLDLVQALVQQGFKLNKFDWYGKNALFYCLDSWSDDSDVLEYLIKQGVPLNA